MASDAETNNTGNYLIIFHLYFYNHELQLVITATQNSEILHYLYFDNRGLNSKLSSFIVNHHDFKALLPSHISSSELQRMNLYPK